MLSRSEDAAVLGKSFPAEAESTSALARRADAGIFGPGDPAEAEVQAYWSDVEKLRAQLAGSVGFWQRQRARYSLRSLRADRRADRAAGRRPGGSAADRAADQALVKQPAGKRPGLRAVFSALTRRRSTTDEGEVR